ncbi:DNA-directed RNA polymerase III subunit RPC4 [Battus philenor]|uniref:DNA-directed RNA polymerase III subunit RPC4 n=1 Tax=Battus philenor TaxID=42288 RepID=UPI0035CEF46B
MSNPDDKTPNGVGSDPLQRLASFKPPRDLSLGGVKLNKKVFTPNLNVTRSKNKGPTTVHNREQKKEDKEKKNRRNKKNGPSIIKSTGVFSEGLGSAERSYSRGASYAREADSSPAPQKPTIRVKDIIKIDKELEEEKIKSVAGGSGEGDEEVEDFKRIFDTDAPVKLPMDDGLSHIQTKPTVKIKQEVVVKEEPTEDDCPMTDVGVEEKALPSEFEDTNVLNLLRSDKPTLILLQLPDSLPGRGGPSTRDDDSAIRSRPSDSVDDTPPEAADNRCRLSDLQEGRIGKLQVRRSGKVTLMLGDTMFEVCPGTKAAFHQEAVSIAVDHNTRSANLVGLGPLQHKLNVVPDWQTLFNDMAV